MGEVIARCSKRLNGLYKVNRELDKKQKKTLAEGAVVSRLSYAIEVTSSGSESCIKRLESMQSKAAIYVLGTSRKE